MTKVFISHSSKDKPLAKKIAVDLRKAGIDVWLDEWEIVVGQPISQKIQEGLKGCHFVAVLITRNSIKSGWVEKEWQSRIGEEAEKKRIVILPLKADNCEIPILLKDKKYADFTKDYDIALESLIIAIRTLAYNLIEKSSKRRISLDKDALLSIESYDLISLAIQWITDQLSDKEWVLPLCSPKREGITLDKLLQKKFDFFEWGRFPWGPTLAIQPDIIGAIKLKESGIYGWVTGMAYPNTMFEYDVIQSRHYIDATNAYLGYVFWDMQKGFSPDGFKMLTTYSTDYTGRNESGQNEKRFINYVMYSREHSLFIEDLETALWMSAGRRK